MWRTNTKLQYRQSGKWFLSLQFFFVLDCWYTEELKDWNPAVYMIVPSEVSPGGVPWKRRPPREAASSFGGLGSPLPWCDRQWFRGVGTHDRSWTNARMIDFRMCHDLQVHQKKEGRWVVMFERSKEYLPNTTSSFCEHSVALPSRTAVNTIPSSDCFVEREKTQEHNNNSPPLQTKNNSTIQDTKKKDDWWQGRSILTDMGFCPPSVVVDVGKVNSFFWGFRS